MTRENIQVEGHIGTWSVIDERVVMNQKVFLLEHETYGEDTACVIINEKGELLAEEIWNGLDEFEFERCYIEVPIFSENPDENGDYVLLGFKREYVR